MDTIITEHLKSVKQLCESHRVINMYAFGSVVSNQFTAESDVDLLVIFEQMNVGNLLDNFLDLADALERFLNRKVDLVRDKMLSNPYFIDSVNRNKQLLYERKYSEISH